jgi:hypothetical protein
MAICSCLSRKGLHKAILNLAYARGLEGEDLSFSEMLITLFGCRPTRIGLLPVQGFPHDKLVDVCRKEDYDEVHFESNSEQNAYKLNREALIRAVADLIKKGWAITITRDQLIWDENQPRVKSLKKNEFVRLTKKGQDFVEGSKTRKRVFPEKCPA